MKKKKKKKLDTLHLPPPTLQLIKKPSGLEQGPTKI